MAREVNGEGVERVTTPSGYDMRWLSSLADYVQWSVRHSRWPRATHSDPEEDRLAKWLLKQTRVDETGEFDPWRGAILDALRPDWRVKKRTPSRWQRTADELEAWVEAHEGMLPRRATDDPTERRLGIWLVNQRMAARGHHRAEAFTPERRERLDSIHPGWLTPPRGSRAHRTTR